MFIYFITSLFFAFISLSSTAATLTLSDNLVMRDVDGQTLEQSFLTTTQTIDLTPGKHVLVVKYKDVFEDLEFAEDRLVKSDYFVVKFTLSENIQSLTLKTTDINNLNEAERFVKAPELILHDENDTELVLLLETLSDYKLAKQVTKVVTTLAVSSDSAVNPSADLKKSMTGEKAENFNAKVMKDVDAMPMLKYWWSKANREQQSAFLKFIKNE